LVKAELAFDLVGLELGQVIHRLYSNVLVIFNSQQSIFQ
jgi:hypothetical protein